MKTVRRTELDHESLSKTNHTAVLYFLLLVFVLFVAGTLYISLQLHTFKQEISDLKREMHSHQLQIDWLTVTNKLENIRETEHFKIIEVTPFTGGDPLTVKLTIDTTAQGSGGPQEMTDLIRLMKNVYDQHKTPEIPEWDGLKIVLSMSATYDKPSGESR